MCKSKYFNKKKFIFVAWEFCCAKDDLSKVYKHAKDIRETVYVYVSLFIYSTKSQECFVVIQFLSGL